MWSRCSTHDWKPDLRSLHRIQAFDPHVNQGQLHSYFLRAVYLYDGDANHGGFLLYIQARYSRLGIRVQVG